MFLSRWQAIAANFLAYLFLPIVVLISLWSFRGSALADKSLAVAMAGSIIFFLYRTGYWETVNYYLRYIFLFLFGVLSIGVFLSPSTPGLSLPLIIAAVTILVPISILNYHALAAVRYPKESLNLQFPFREGVYLITDGGDGARSSWMNYHYQAGVHQGANTHQSMRYATDIVKLNRWGMTYRSLLIPRKNEDFEIYEECVYSPCSGVVVGVVDGIGDNEPFSRNYPYNVGNHVVLQNGTFYIIMGHFKAGTLIVKPEMTIEAGEILGKIGSSGLSPRPHIHMQASKAEDGDYWNGVGVPLSFQGKFPVKNRFIIDKD